MGVFPRNSATHTALTFGVQPQDWRLAAMIADMQRLENAARLAMGDFEGPSALPPRAQPLFHGLLRPGYLLLMLVAAGLLAATLF
jgi:hypothetical protein